MNIQIIYANVGAINNRQSQIIGAEYQLVCQSELRFQVRALINGTVPWVACDCDTVPWVFVTLAGLKEIWHEYF